ncbi:hypothetical protein ES703_65371 [subsurface metagenome]
MKIRHTEPAPGQPPRALLLIELERTPEAVAVSGVSRRGGVRRVKPSDTPSTNLRSPDKFLPSLPETIPQNLNDRCYLETEANVSFEAKKALHKMSEWLNFVPYLQVTCDKKAWFVSGECQNGHSFAKVIACGKEWCQVCGEDASIAHNRRFVRWLAKARQMPSIGYFVFTIPLELRAHYKTRRALKEFGHKVQEALKRQGYTRGLRRWHFFGDKSTLYNPHLNVFVDAEYVGADKLEAIKRAYATLLGVEMADVHYHYLKSPGEKVHALKYVCRSTFRAWEWDIDLAMELRGFRNQISWGRGRWNNEPCWSLSDLKGEAKAEVEGLDIEAIEALAEKRCPVCREPVVWGGVLPLGLLDMVSDKQPLGAGYWRMPDIRPPPELPADVKTRLYWLELVHRVQVQEIAARGTAEVRAEAEDYQAWWASLMSSTESL